ncbi:polysaccharide biosynthesis C-terminal domain-containing protein [Paracrocinitomix mangrovi]|uniref:lipopolysaccharide biosynthesis protein n=1 Tax=Paracrocinitomix mangrovi TaxID=2862509 RepID=UPI001C8E2BEF|nr:polysaccharide biosynthesis C-terminal domain-containing protein [Paracrocinitomix mangrovi]UKN02775.1 polysaccharide biosynthesis C-terminal domain-containing protein [Paracrocinitomix mangrovi]
MGIIQKQALRSTIVTFIGAGFGAVSRLSMPVILSEMQIGFLTLLDAVSGMFMTIFSLGFDQILARLFPRFRNDSNGHNGFFLLGIFLSFIGIGMSFIAYYFLKDYLLPNSDVYGNYSSFVIFIFPLIFFRVLFRNMDGYAGMLMNTVLGAFLDGLVSKVLLLLGLMGFALSWLNFDHLTLVFVSSLCIPGLIITFYGLFKTTSITLPSKEFRQPEIRKEIFQYIGFGVLMGASNSIIFYIDSLMVNKLISLEALGVYSTYFFAARLMSIPSRSLGRISTVVLAESWKNNDIDNIDEVYKKSCLNQLLIGTFLLGVGWACLEPAIHYLPGDKSLLYNANKYVFFFLGIGLLVELATGVNANIIGTSKKFKFNTYFNLSLAVFVTILNYIFIQLYSLEGAALATMTAMILVNFMRWFFLVKTYGFQPFDSKFLKAAIFSLLFILAAHFIDYDATPSIKIIINAVSFTAVFVGVAYFFNLSEDLKNLIKKAVPFLK